jgi:hypothetical protein
MLARAPQRGSGFMRCIGSRSGRRYLRLATIVGPAGAKTRPDQDSRDITRAERRQLAPAGQSSIASGFSRWAAGKIRTE